MGQNISAVKQIFEADNSVKLAYLFGSRAGGDVGPLSDYDFAVYLDVDDKSESFEKKVELQDKIGRLLKTNDVDVVTLNDTENPELKYGIVSEGKLLYEREPYKLLVEPDIFNEYFDFAASLQRHGLTKVS